MERIIEEVDESSPALVMVDSFRPAVIGQLADFTRARLGGGFELSRASADLGAEEGRPAGSHRLHASRRSGLDWGWMPPKPHQTEREQTDESLRVEREKADEVVGEHLSTIEERADAILRLARERADRLLAATRARTDRGVSPESGSPSSDILRRERQAEDQLLQQERHTADEALRGERAAHAALLAAERDETDKDLLAERSRADDALATRDEFLGLVSHDLRNMLNGIAGFAAIIASDLSEGRPVGPSILHARRIERSGAG